MAKGSNFFHNLLSSIMGGNDPEATKKRMLKNIDKELSRTKFHFYKSGKHEAEPQLAKFFYDIYKAISPAQLMFQNANQNPGMLKNLVINASLTEKQLEDVERFSEESITDLASKSDLKTLQKHIIEDLKSFSAQFDSTRINQIDALYSKTLAFSNFCSFDYYFILKKFDSSIREHNFSTLPKFQPINGTYILEELKNFCAVAWALPLDAPWDDMFVLLKKIKTVEPITANVWKKIVARLRTLKERQVFEMMVQLISENPAYKENVKIENHHIMDDYISQIKKQVEKTVNSLKKKQAEGKIEKLVTEIFGTTNIDSLKNYNSGNSANLERKNFKGYIYQEPLKYLKHFILNFGKKEIRELSDILLVRGEWATQQMAKPMSEAFHQLMEISEKITKLDDKLAENAEWGMKIKTLMPRADRDKEARNIINMVLGDTNEAAAQMIVSARNNLIIYDKNLKMALEDFVKAPHSEIIINWKDLDHFAEGTLKNQCISVYKTIYAFVQLIQNFNVQVHVVPKE